MTAVSKEIQPLDNGGHKMTAVSEEIEHLDNGSKKMTVVTKEMPLAIDNGGHKMTPVSKEIQPLDNELVTGGAQKSLGISNLAPRGVKCGMDNRLVSGEILTLVR